MELTQKQLLTLQQRLSPQQIQMIKLLELPTVQLEQRIKQEIENNIMLEEEEQPEEKERQQTSLEEYLREDNLPSYKSHTNNYAKDERQQRSFYLTEGRSLQDSLAEQLGFRNLSERDQAMATFLIGSIDEDGYLRRGLSSVSDDIAFTTGREVSVRELERVLGIIQQMEPAGIGARSLRECLLLQITRRPLDTPARRLAYRILTDYFDEFTKKHYEKLIARLQVSEAEFRDALEEITGLTPKPADGYTENADTAVTPYIIPDFILDYQDGEFHLTLNSYNEPELRINPRYANMMQDMIGADGKVKEKDRETFQFVKSKFDSAKWFMQAIAQRHETLMYTMRAILDYQQEFFKEGELAKLRPMILKNIADMTGLDISTVSRVVSSKYVQTRFGIIYLKALFSEAIQTDSGDVVSSYEIKQIVRECVDRENKQHPLTDEDLLEILRSKGYHIARRTIAKYRELLDIPVARMRREL